jgi:hypothetical protein
VSLTKAAQGKEKEDPNKEYIARENNEKGEYISHPRNYELFNRFVSLRRVVVEQVQLEKGK